MKNYDFTLAKKIIETFTATTEVESASMGMHEDWFWTADTVWTTEGYTDTFKTGLIGGIDGSTWATPVIQLTLVSGETHTFNCYKSEGEEKDILERIRKMSLCASGPISSQVTDKRIKNIDVKDFNPEQPCSSPPTT